MAYPLVAAEREKQRSDLRAALVQRAEREAVTLYSKPSCDQGRHTGTGCQDDGSGCLCPCHDPQYDSGGQLTFPG